MSVSMNDHPLVQIRIIDVIAAARRAGLGDLIPDGAEHDYRLAADTPTGGSITFHRGATADYVIAYWRHEGWLPEVADA